MVAFAVKQELPQFIGNRTNTCNDRMMEQDELGCNDRHGKPYAGAGGKDEHSRRKDGIPVSDHRTRKQGEIEDGVATEERFAHYSAIRSVAPKKKGARHTEQKSHKDLFRIHKHKLQSSNLEITHDNSCGKLGLFGINGTPFEARSQGVVSPDFPMSNDVDMIAFYALSLYN